MIREIENIKKTRAYLLNSINSLSVDELNEIPQGFNNNIIWNLGHMVAAQQGVCYLRRGAQLAVEEKYWLNYKPGSKPAEFIDAAEVQAIKDLLFTTLDRLSTDYGRNIFNNYSAWTTRYGTELGSIDDAIRFLPYHEGLHGGTIMVMIKLVTKHETI
jgi:hypothetical protein